MKNEVFGKKVFLFAALGLLAVSLLVIALTGSRYTVSFDLGPQGGGPHYGAEDYSVTMEDPGIAEITGVSAEGRFLKIRLRSLHRGATFLMVQKQENLLLMEKVYVHSGGVITLDTFFGSCSGGFLIPLSLLVFLILIYVNRIRKLRYEMRQNLFRYRNILNFGLIVFLSFLILKLVQVTLRFRGIDASVYSVLSSAGSFACVVLPVAFAVSIMISLSNLNLMRKEGVTWRNMLGFLLGLGICLLTLLPDVLYGYILKHQVVDIFNQKGIGSQVYSLFEYSLFFVVAYLECILAGTVVLGIRAARHVPSFDKDYILILGSQIRPDGTLTPLLRARADKALEFAEMQKEAAGRELIFVPSGGKGEDEVISEAEAIGNYLRSRGVPEERILPETRSLNTYENVRNSMELISRRETGADGGNGGAAETQVPGTAFSTSNYHVFRAGLIASDLGFPMEGIGSPTKRYFWVNAFIREFIATLVSERKRHAKVIGVLFAGVLVMVALNYLSVLL